MPPPLDPSRDLDTLREVAERFAAQARLDGPATARLAPGAALVLIALLLRAPARQTPVWRVLMAIGLVLPVLGGLAHAWHLFWLSDDAFISLRYARNLLEGHGLVWNPGERVEGFTNSLWTLLMAAGLRAGARGEVVLAALGLSAFALLLLGTARLAARVSGGRAPLLSAAACLMAGSYLFACFGSSGLETAFAAALVVWSLERALAGRVGAASTLGVFATMTHPDHFLFWVSLLAALAWEPLRATAVRRMAVPRGAAHDQRGSARAADTEGGRPEAPGDRGNSCSPAQPLAPERRPESEAPDDRGSSSSPAAPTWRPVLVALLPFALLLLPWLLLRAAYYGDLWPNTWYAKSGGEAYLRQGAVYVVATLLGGYFLVLLPFAAVGVWRRRGDLFGRFLLLAVPLFVLYVARVGGDFMFGRLLLTPLALLLIAAEVGARDLVERRWPLAVPAAATLAAVMLPFTLIEPVEKTWHLADERSFYDDPSGTRLAPRSHYARWGETLGRIFAEDGDRVVVAMQSVGIVGWTSRLRVVDMLGLNDRSVARQPLASRGRPGHEKRAGPAYLLSRGVHLADDPLFPAPYDALARVGFPGFRLGMARQDPWLVHALAQTRGVSFVDHATYLDRYAPPGNDRARAECDLWFSNLHYFSVRSDVARRTRLHDQLQAVGVLDATTRAFLEAPGDFRPRRLLGFDGPRLDGWTRAGAAMVPGVVREAPPGQVAPGPVRGGFLDTFVEGAGDRATGVAESPPFLLDGDVLTLNVGGGMDPERLRVSLVVGGVRVASATGCNTEVMGMRAWSVGAHRGAQATLEVVDDSRGSWGHVVLDEVVLWSRR